MNEITLLNHLKWRREGNLQLPTGKTLTYLRYLADHQKEILSERQIDEACGFDYKGKTQLRHLGHKTINYKGYYLFSGVKGGILPDGRNMADYDFQQDGSPICLWSLGPSPNNEMFLQKPSLTKEEFEELKKLNDNKCIMCGREEGTFNEITNTIVKLERGHINSLQPLSYTNCVPECSVCNHQHMQNPSFGGWNQTIFQLRRAGKYTPELAAIIEECKTNNL